jgi:hypothetical protein
MIIFLIHNISNMISTNMFAALSENDTTTTKVKISNILEQPKILDKLEKSNLQQKMTNNDLSFRTFEISNVSDGNNTSSWIGVKSKYKHNNSEINNTDKNNISSRKIEISNNQVPIDNSTKTKLFPNSKIDAETAKTTYASMISKDTPYSKPYTYIKPNTEIPVNNFEQKKKSFSNQTIKRDGELQHPEHYQIRSDDKYEVPMNEYKWIRRVGGLEKADTIQNMIVGVVNCAANYFCDRTILLSNPFFKKYLENITIKDKDQETLFELILIHTTSILLHRLIKSDTVDIIKTLINSFPIYRVIHGNPFEHTTLSNSNASVIYKHIKDKWLGNQRIINNHKKNPESIDPLRLQKAIDEDTFTHNLWSEYILQSVWNGNNLIHDCLYYGSKFTFGYLLEYYFTHNMIDELSAMMSKSNIQKETHKDIIYNGKKACEAQSTYILRKSHFEECERLYNKSIINIREHQKEKQPIVITHTNTNTNTETNTYDTSNIIELINKQDVSCMVEHIVKCNQTKNYDVILATIDIWKSIVIENSNLSECLDDVIGCFEIQEILNIINASNS